MSERDLDTLATALQLLELDQLRPDDLAQVLNKAGVFACNVRSVDALRHEVGRWAMKWPTDSELQIIINRMHDRTQHAFYEELRNARKYVR